LYVSLAPHAVLSSAISSTRGRLAAGAHASQYHTYTHGQMDQRRSTMDGSEVAARRSERSERSHVRVHRRSAKTTERAQASAAHARRSAPRHAPKGVNAAQV